jgi:hypothetical protein
VKFISAEGSNKLINEDGLTYLLNTKNPTHGFTYDLAQSLHEGWTVTYVALQIAYLLGFSKVFIIGMDHNFNYSGAPNQTNIIEGKDLNHFDSSYFGFGKKWDNPDIEMSEQSYLIVKRAYEADGREIIDATLDGHCDIFKKMDYRELLTP